MPLKMTNPPPRLWGEGLSCATTMKFQLGEEFLGHSARPEELGKVYNDLIV